MHSNNEKRNQPRLYLNHNARHQESSMCNNQLHQNCDNKFRTNSNCYGQSKSCQPQSNDLPQWQLNACNYSRTPLQTKRVNQPVQYNNNWQLNNLRQQMHKSNGSWRSNGPRQPVCNSNRSWQSKGPRQPVHNFNNYWQSNAPRQSAPDFKDSWLSSSGGQPVHNSNGFWQSNGPRHPSHNTNGFWHSTNGPRHPGHNSNDSRQSNGPGHSAHSSNDSRQLNSSGQELNLIDSLISTGQRQPEGNTYGVFRINGSSPQMDNFNNSWQSNDPGPLIHHSNGSVESDGPTQIQHTSSHFSQSNNQMSDMNALNCKMQANCRIASSSSQDEESLESKSQVKKSKAKYHKKRYKKKANYSDDKGSKKSSKKQSYPRCALEDCYKNIFDTAANDVPWDEYHPRYYESPDYYGAGLYYDEEKDKYFKIQMEPTGDGLYSPDAIRQRENEKQRVKCIEQQKNFEDIKNTNIVTFQKKTIDLFQCRSAFSLVTTTPYCNNSGRGHGFKSLYRSIQLRNISQVASKKISGAEISRENSLISLRKFVPQTVTGRFITVWETSNPYPMIIILKMTSIEPISEYLGPYEESVKFNLVEEGISIAPPKDDSITSACWINEDPLKQDVLFVVHSPMDITKNTAYIRCCSPSDSDSRVWQNYPILTPDVVNVCAWDSHHQRFSVGSNYIQIFTPEQNNRRASHKKYSNRLNTIYSQVFDRDTGNILFCGDNNNHIQIYDLRERKKTYCLDTFQHVLHLHSQAGGNYLLASLHKGEIQQIDLRQRKIVQAYSDRKGRYLRAPFHVDDSEKVLSAVDEKGYMFLWDVNTGELLKQLPSPLPVSTEKPCTMPSICYGEEWGRGLNYPGMFAMISKDMFFYA